MKHKSLLLLLAGAALMLFSNGRWIIPFATWLFPVFFLRYMRLQKPARGFFGLALASAIVNAIIWWKIIPAPASIYFPITCIFLQVYSLCFLADRLLATRIQSFFSTLVFPTAWCTVEFLTSFMPDKGSEQALAYTQATNLSLMQLASVTGIWGITFLIMWFASVVNWAWSKNFDWKKVSKGVITFAGIAAIVFLFGTVRLNFSQSSSPTVLTASIVQARNINKDLATCRRTDANAIGNFSFAAENNLLQKTEQAAKAGARIVLWQEGAGCLPAREEQKFVAEAKALAAREKIYIFMTMWSVPEDFPKHLVENKLLMINPIGEVQLTYYKNHPVRGAEPIVKGDGSLPVVQTPYGKIAMSICFDGDFQGFIRQAGKNNANILFLPANDWREIDPYHTNVAITRAIENGFSLIHPTGQGFSVVTDNRGRIISSMDFFKTDEQIMYAPVPFYTNTTWYAQAGDVFAWLCIAGFVALISSVVFRRFFFGVNELNKKEKTGFESKGLVTMAEK